MLKVRRLAKILIGLPKSFIINFRCLAFKEAIKLPILVTQNVKFYSLKGKIVIKSPIRTGMIKIGLGGAGTLSYQPTILELNGDVICKGELNIGGGSEIVTVNKDSKLIFGSCVNFTGGVKIISRKSISIGNNCIVSWDTQIMDTDFHKMFSGDKMINEDKEIVIGNNVWIGSRCNILKGCIIENDNIIASGSNIHFQIVGNHQVASGSPLKILKTNVRWER